MPDRIYRLPSAVIALLVAFAATLHATPDGPGKRPPAAAKKTEALFSKIPPSSSGLDFQNQIVLDHPMDRLYHSGFVCGGVAIGDFDGDARPDLFFVSGPGQNRLFRQSGDFVFEDITEQAGIGGGDAWGAGPTAVDIESDGDLDIYVCNYDSPNALYLNDGTGKFREAAAEFGLDLVDSSLLPTFCDYDRDGDLDVWVVTNRYYRKGGRPEQPPFEQAPDGRVIVKPEFAKYYSLKQSGPKAYDMDEVGRPDLLLRNDGGEFTDISAAAGIQKEGHGLSATWWDFDDDGFMDIYVANDFADPDHLFRNNGDGTFTDVITGVVNYTPWFSMGSDAGDINNDGLLDFIALDMAATTHYKSKISMGEMGALE
ncbi:MAG: FG-GAP repeat domain-containing protein, partial [Verrucomicrobiales bacterium]